MQSGDSSYFQILSLTHVMSLLPDRLYPGIQSTSTLVPWFTGREILVFRLKISGSPVHLSEIMHCIIMTVDSLFYFYLFENKFNEVLPKSNPAFDSCETRMNNNGQKKFIPIWNFISPCPAQNLVQRPDSNRSQNHNPRRFSCM